MILVEVGEPSLWIVNFIEEENNEMLKETLNLDEEAIKEVHMRVELYQRRAEKRYNSWVKLRNFLANNLVVRKCGEAWKDPRVGKLVVHWEDPFIVAKELGKKHILTRTLNRQDDSKNIECHSSQVLLQLNL